MMESYREADCFFEESFSTREVPLSGLKDYKKTAAKRKLCRKHIDQYEIRDFKSLIFQNLYKWHHICHGTWANPNYEKYVMGTTNSFLLKRQQQLSIEKEILSVINTSLFLIVNY